MEYFLLALVWILNLAISCWNAYACGKAWVEAKYHGGWPRFMTWMGAIMAASGFSWCFLVLLALLAHWFDWLTPEQTKIAFQLGYILIIPGVLFSGLMITVDSWAIAFRTRRIGDFGIAAYNTFAQAYNTYNAIRDFGTAFRDVTNFFGESGRSSGDDKDDSGGKAVLIVVLIVAIAILGGILLTAAIIRRVAASQPLPSWEEVQKNRAADAPRS
jgi:hypothetical protein